MGNHGSLKVLLTGIAAELRNVIGVKRHGHTLLGFGNGQLRTIKTVVFLRHRIQVHVQTVSKLADGNGYAAGTKVVAAFNQAARVTATEKPLKLALNRCVSLLDLRAVAFNGRGVVSFGGAGGTSDAVATSATS